MKQLILFLFLNLVCLSSIGQIRRDLRGVVLGKTSFSETSQLLRNEKHHPVSTESDSHLTIYATTHPYSYANVPCRQSDYLFADDVCYKIVHAFKHDAVGSEKGQFAKLVKALGAKYAAFRKTAVPTKPSSYHLSRRQSLQTPQSVPPTVYEDGETFLVIDHENFSITYVDKHLQEQIDKENAEIICEPRRHFGFTLGETTLREAKRKFGNETAEQSDQTTVDAVEKTTNFAGYTCKARLSFYNGIFYKATLVCTDRTRGDAFEYFKQCLDARYQNECTAKRRDAMEYMVNGTLISLSGAVQNYGDNHTVVLEYTDTTIRKQAEEIDLDDI